MCSSDKTISEWLRKKRRTLFIYPGAQLTERVFRAQSETNTKHKTQMQTHMQFGAENFWKRNLKNKIRRVFRSLEDFAIENEWDRISVLACVHETLSCVALKKKTLCYDFDAKFVMLLLSERALTACEWNTRHKFWRLDLGRVCWMVRCSIAKEDLCLCARNTHWAGINSFHISHFQSDTNLSSTRTDHLFVTNQNKTIINNNATSAVRKSR